MTKFDEEERAFGVGHLRRERGVGLQEVSRVKDALKSKSS